MGNKRRGGVRETGIEGWARLCLVSAILAVVAAGVLAPYAPGPALARKRKPVQTGLPILPNDKTWQKAKQEVDRNVVDILKQREAELAKGLKYHIFLRGDPNKKKVAITFDDGPHPKFTPKLLEILKKYDAKATFFVVGEMAKMHPSLIKDEVAAGHAVGNHTYHHVTLTQIPADLVAAEIKACGDVLRQITGRPPHLFRPPGGDYNKRVAEAAEALGYTMVLWTDDPGDYASPGVKVIDVRLLSRLSNGGIILIHDGVQQTIDGLPSVLSYLKSRGYKLVTVDELISDSAGPAGKRP